MLPNSDEDLDVADSHDSEGKQHVEEGVDVGVELLPDVLGQDGPALGRPALVRDVRPVEDERGQVVEHGPRPREGDHDEDAALGHGAGERLRDRDALVHAGTRSDDVLALHISASI